MIWRPTRLAIEAPEKKFEDVSDEASGNLHISGQPVEEQQPVVDLT